MRILKSALISDDDSGRRRGGPGPFASSDPDGHIIEWAFAGKTHTRPKTGGGECKQSVWEHWIDSKSATPDTEVDEGDMYPLPNGDVLERGTQAHPITGKQCEYEELWTDLKVEGVAGERNDLNDDNRQGGGEGGGGGGGGEGSNKKRVSVVIKAEDAQGKVVGMVVRVGKWVQGVMRNTDGTLGVERWCCGKHGQGQGEEEWKCVAQVGDGMMPCPMTFGGAAVFLKEGQGVPGSGGVWTVVEICRW